MKQVLLIALIALFAAAAIVLGLRLCCGDEDTWLCQDGQWIKHGNPSSPKPTAPCGSQATGVFITSPLPDQLISSPLTVKGRAKGNWFFEANARLRLLDAQQKEIASGNVQALGDWMTADLVDFEGQIRFVSPASDSGSLVFQNDNPSGLPEHHMEFCVPVRFDASRATKVKAYFGNHRLDPEASCDKVFPVEREIPHTQASARAAVEELLAGPTGLEQAAGYFTSINPGVTVRRLTIQNGVVTVDFDEQLESQVGGSCRVAAIRAQIDATLMQFSTVRSVIVSISGRTEDILQP
jgi:hypothetical protein